MGRKALTEHQKAAAKSNRAERQRERRRQAELLSLDPLAPLSTEVIQPARLNTNPTDINVNPKDFTWPYPKEQGESQIGGTGGFEDEGNFLVGPENIEDSPSQDGSDPQLHFLTSNRGRGATTDSS